MRLSVDLRISSSFVCVWFPLCVCVCIHVYVWYVVMCMYVVLSHVLMVYGFKKLCLCVWLPYVSTCYVVCIHVVVYVSVLYV